MIDKFQILNLFNQQTISFSLLDETFDYEFFYNFQTRTDKPIDEFMMNPEALSLVARWRESPDQEQFKGLNVQSYYKTKQMKDQIGVVLKLKEGASAVLSQEGVSFHKKYPFLTPEEKEANQNNPTYLRVYAGKKQKSLEALLLKQVEMYHRSYFEAPDLTTKEAILFFLDFCQKSHIHQQLETEGKLDINKMLSYLKLNNYKILRRELEEQNLLTLLEKEGISQALKDRFQPDEQGYVSYGILPPVIRFQMKEVLEGLESELGAEFTLDRVRLELKTLIEKRAAEKLQEISKNKYVVPSHAVATTQNGLEEKNFSFKSAYSQSSVEEHEVVKQNTDKAAVSELKKKVLGTEAATTKQPVPGFGVVPSGFTLALDPNGHLLKEFEIVAQFSPENKKNTFYPPDSESYEPFEKALDPAAMYENSKASHLAVEKLNFHVRRTIDGLGGSFILDKGRLSFVIPIKGDKEDKKVIAMLEKKCREAFGLTSNYYIRPGFPRIVKDVTIAVSGKDKYKETYYSFDFNIGPDYFLRKVLLPHLSEQAQVDPLRIEEKEEGNKFARVNELDLVNFHTNLKSLHWNTGLASSIFEFASKHPQEAYTTINTGGQVYETPLHWICFAFTSGQITKAYLLDYLRLPDVSKNINQHNGWGYTPLHEAIIRGASPELILVLLDFGADAKALTIEPYSGKPAHLALQYSTLDLVLMNYNLSSIEELEEKIKKLTDKIEKLKKPGQANDLMDGIPPVSAELRTCIRDLELLNTVRWTYHLLKENGAKVLNKSVCQPRPTFYNRASHSINSEGQGWTAIIAQRCASVILTDKEQNVLNVHIPTILNALQLAEKNNVKILDLILPDAFLDQGVKGMTLLQVACRKGQLQLADTLLTELKKQYNQNKKDFNPYRDYIEQAFMELKPLMSTNKIAVGAILHSLLNDYPEYYQHYTPAFKTYIKDLVFQCKANQPGLYEAYDQALRKQQAPQKLFQPAAGTLPQDKTLASDSRTRLSFARR